MQGDDIGSLIYLVLLGLMIAGFFVAQNRMSLNRTLQSLAIWVLIFFGVVAAYGLWGDIRQTVMPQQTSFAETGQIVVPRSPDGHYYIRADVNGASTLFVLDTGATDMVLTQEDARRAGLDPQALNYIGRAMTANGEVRTAPVWLESVTLGAVTDRNLPATVNAGEMSQSLLGMTYLQRWGRIEIEGGELTLTR
ncbi:retropepsin-like aspartic protease family protein [Roseobacter ponti]|uniref:TIGR02281 family clan AA aspartic protease n=1 Tax=Roseobacter ponti TaxID=1891787 RepID=A0A858SQ84_9RHOB|nr:TIGR02281 family clan AA aspartic protease [Roseobacter ponti]QJF51009.1 TIGR02281 family clan AA aspartic protease [Roseobacter ponti]